MSDLISRQQAIDAIRDMPAFDDDNEQPYLYLYDVMAVFTDEEELPTVKPKRGRWLYCEDTTADCVDGYRCDQCGLFVPWDYQHKSIDYIKDYNFCPNCGADMRGEQNE